MFYEGDVQSGIAAALQTGKCVTCFVTDDGHESAQWQSERLEVERITQLLSRCAVLLRISFDSQEASQLSAFYPISSAPTLLIIHKGKLEAQIERDSSQDQFIQAVFSCFKRIFPGCLDPNQQPVSQADSELPGSSTTDNTDESAVTRLDESSRTATGLRESTSPRHELSKVAQRSELGKAPKQETYVERQARQKKEALGERERVRKLIESDKRERKARDEQRRKEMAESAAQEEKTKQEMSKRQADASRARDPGSSASVQIRLLDGSTLRHTFGAKESLLKDVRRWVDQNRVDNDVPYTFKQIRTPKPSHPMSDEDERKTLSEAGLIPSATLALVPVTNFAEAYRAKGPWAVIKGGPMVLLSYVIAIVSILIAKIRDLMGLNGGDNTSTALHSSTKPSRAPVKTLDDQGDGSTEGAQLYNGNTLNFERNKDDEDQG